MIERGDEPDKIEREPTDYEDASQTQFVGCQRCTNSDAMYEVHHPRSLSSSAARALAMATLFIIVLGFGRLLQLNHFIRDRSHGHEKPPLRQRQQRSHGSRGCAAL